MTLDDLTELAIRLQRTVSKQLADGKVAIALSPEDDRVLTAELKVKYANYFKEEAFPTTLGGGKFMGVPIVVRPDTNRVAELERALDAVVDKAENLMIGLGMGWDTAEMQTLLSDEISDVRKARGL